jgi:hypothetical protein
MGAAAGTSRISFDPQLWYVTGVTNRPFLPAALAVAFA